MMSSLRKSSEAINAGRNDTTLQLYKFKAKRGCVYTYFRMVLDSALIAFIEIGIGEIAVEDVLAATILVTCPYLYVEYVGGAGPVSTHAPPCLPSL
jgi:hypothetical protein